MAFRQHFGQLFADAFAADCMDARSEFADRSECDGLDVEAEAGGESDGAKETKLVFFEALFGSANGSYDASIEVIKAADVVEDGRAELSAIGEQSLERDGVERGIEEEAVDCEVAALDVFGGGLGVPDFIGVTAIGVDAVVAESGDLGNAALCDVAIFAIAVLIGRNQNHAEMGSHGEGARKHGEDEIGSGGGCDVVVLRLPTEEEVADATAGKVRVVAGRTKRADDLDGGVELG